VRVRGEGGRCTRTRAWLLGIRGGLLRVSLEESGWACGLVGVVRGGITLDFRVASAAVEEGTVDMMRWKTTLRSS
jgi:hypothetical protein